MVLSLHATDIKVSQVHTFMGMSLLNVRCTIFILVKLSIHIVIICCYTDGIIQFENLMYYVYESTELISVILLISNPSSFPYTVLVTANDGSATGEHF